MKFTKLLSLFFMLIFLANSLLADIKTVQKQLNEMGYRAGPEDGLWGNKTENAVKLFLSDNKLKWDGIFDQNEINLIEKIFLSKGFKSTPKLGVNSSTSTDRISRNFCKFIEPTDILVNQMGSINSYLNFISTSVSPIELFDWNEKTISSLGNEILIENLNEKNKLHFEKGIFVDVGGDGVMDHVTKVVTFEDPKHKLPVVIWPDGKKYKDSKKYKKHRANKYGFGFKFGIEIDGLHIDKILPGDLNHDGIIDLVFLDYGEHDYDNHKDLMGGSIIIAMSFGENNYQITKINKPNNLWHHGVLADYDSDGALDIIAVGGAAPNNHNLKSAYVFLNTGNGNFSSAKTINASKTGTAYAIAASDIFGDERPEIVIASTSYKKGEKSVVSIFNGSKIIKRYKLKNNSYWTIPDIVFADVNSDSEKDIVLIQASYNLDRFDKTNKLTALIIKDGRISSEKVIFDGKKPKFGGDLFGHTVSCDNRLFILNRYRSSYWRVH